jgi:hypothetical protein
VGGSSIAINRVGNDRQHSVDILHHIVIPKPQDAVTVGLHEGIARDVALPLCSWSADDAPFRA